MATDDKAENRGLAYMKRTRPLRLRRSALLTGVAKEELLKSEEQWTFNSLCDSFEIDKLSEADRNLVLIASLSLIKALRYEKEAFADQAGGFKDSGASRAARENYDLYIRCVKEAGLSGRIKQETASQAAAAATISELLGGVKQGKNGNGRLTD